MKTFCTILASLIVIGLTGCSNKANNEAEKAAAVSAQSFDQAPAPLKEKYQAVVTAIQSNDFAAAKAALDQLSQSQLSPEQDQAVADQRNQLMTKLAKAAQDGDAKAAQMIQDLRYQGRSR